MGHELFVIELGDGDNTLVLGILFSIYCICFQFFSFFKRLIYLLFERDRESKHAVGKEGQRERSPSRFPLNTDPDMGLNPITLGSQPDLKSRVGHVTNLATQVLLFFTVFNVSSFSFPDKFPIATPF